TGIAQLAVAGSTAVEREHAFPGWDGIRNPALAVVQIDDMDLLVTVDPRGFHEVRGNGHRAFIVQGLVCDADVMDLGTDKRLHGVSLGGAYANVYETRMDENSACRRRRWEYRRSTCALFLLTGARPARTSRQRGLFW